VGWSVGGILAQAMAVRLHEIGRDFGELVLLDAYPSECWRAEPEPDPMAALRALLAIAAHYPDPHPELDSRERILGFLRRGGSALG
ncbi:thioesterase domain-containing protein, partial [Pseudomonas syringae group genomosp. 7]|uniref:thioesterase domain-containing protein n=1 Tax=Pseudomonas syringae group genomosp. 7 TaxID=251699 RepID=UPI00376F95C8